MKLVVVLIYFISSIFCAQEFYDQNSEEFSVVRTTFGQGEDSLVYVYVADYYEDPKLNQTYNGTIQKTVFFPEVDKVSRLDVVGSTKYRVSENTTIWISVGGVNSTKQRFSDGNRFVPFWNVFAVLQKGKVTSVQFYKDCGECSAIECLDGNFCTRDAQEVDCSIENCNIQVYFGWYGSDKTEEQCLSFAALPSAFLKFSVTPVVTFGEELIDDTFSWAT